MKLNTFYNIGQKVNIKELNIKGKIKSIHIDSGGIEYGVDFFLSSERKNLYFQEEDIEIFEEKSIKPFQNES